MKKHLSLALGALLSLGTASAQTAVFKNYNSNVATYKLANVSRFSYIPPDSTTYIDPATIENLDKFMPNPGVAYGYYNLYSELFNIESNFNFHYMKQSEHFFLFWDKRYGEDPKLLNPSDWGYVDTDKLLTKAEDFFNTNIKKLGMCTLGESWLDDYKMQIWLYYDDGWGAYGSGWGNIGCIWITPQTCKNIGFTIAHEIGHAFQHMTGADRYLRDGGRVGDYSFRYNWGQGCTYWEQCAQWQAFQHYPSEIFTQSYPNWFNNYHRHFCHEWMRYQSFWWQYWMVQQQGDNAFAQIWRQATSPEDPLEVYCRLYKNSDWSAFWDDYYQYAAHVLTFDLPTVRNYRAANPISSDYTKYATNLVARGNGRFYVAYASVPETSGMNFIRLDLPADGQVSIDFEALAPGSELAGADPGQYYSSEDEIGGTVETYNAISGQCEPDFRYGYVAIVDGKAVYGDMHQGATGSAAYTVSEGATDLYFVVVPAPTTYNRHAWDNYDLNDVQWPYAITVAGSLPTGYVDVDLSSELSDLLLEYTVQCDATLTSTTQGTIDLNANGDVLKVAQAFGMQPTEISAATATINSRVVPSAAEGRVVFLYEDPDGSLASGAYTASSGFYAFADGTKGKTADGAFLLVEYNPTTMVFTYGATPGVAQAGDSYTIRPCLVYTKDSVQYRVTFAITMQF